MGKEEKQYIDSLALANELRLFLRSLYLHLYGHTDSGFQAMKFIKFFIKDLCNRFDFDLPFQREEICSDEEKQTYFARSLYACFHCIIEGKKKSSDCNLTSSMYDFLREDLGGYISVMKTLQRYSQGNFSYIFEKAKDR